MLASLPKAKLVLLLAFAALLVCNEASAQINNSGILNDVLDRYQNAAAGWAGVITQRATWLFMTLAAISAVWTFGMMVLRKADIGEIFAELVRFILFTGFFLWLLRNGPAFAQAIIAGLRNLAGMANNLGPGLTPSGIVDIGFAIFAKVQNSFNPLAPVDTAVGLLIATVVLVVFALVGVNMLILLIAAWILSYAGIFFLGFGGSKWTSEMAIGYYRTVLGVAAQLFAMVLLVGIGNGFVTDYFSRMSAGLILMELVVMLVVAVILLALVNKVPQMIGSLAGGNTGSLGSGFGAGSVVSAAAVGAAAMATAGAAVAAGAANIGGGAQALMAAFSKANAAQSGSGGGAGDLLASSGSGSSGSGGRGADALAAAMGDGPPAAPQTGGTSGSSNSGGAGGGEAGDSSGGGKGASSASDSPESASSGSTTAAQSGGGNAAPAASGEAQLASSAGEAAGETSSETDAKSSNKGSRIGAAAAAAGAAAARVGRVAAGTAGNLALGSFDVAKDKAVSLKDSALDRMSQTTGGKIAAAIKTRAATEAAQRDESPLAAFTGNTLAGSTETSVDAAAEIAAFRDRKAS